MQAHSPPFPITGRSRPIFERIIVPVDLIHADQLTRAVIAHDPAVELRNKMVDTAAERRDADLIVMASHVPSPADH